MKRGCELDLRSVNPLNNKTKDLFILIDSLNEHHEKLNSYAVTRKSNRLNQIEKSAIEIERLSILIQEQLKLMRRK